MLPHLARLLRFAQRRTVSQCDADDAVQDACVKAWLSFGELRATDQARPWLYRILRGVLGDGVGTTKRRRLLAEITPLTLRHETTLGGDHDAVMMEVATRINAERLARAFASIPPDFAAAVVMHDIDGFRHHEIAAHAGVPIGTVMSRIWRGRRRLAGTLTPR